LISGGTLETLKQGVIVAGASGLDLTGLTIATSTLVEVAGGGTATLVSGTIDAGALVVTLSGGTLLVSGTLTNGGTLFADAGGGLLEIASGAVVKGGVVEINNGDVELLSGSSTTAEIVFTSTGTGGLSLEGTGSVTYSGLRISGFGGVGGAATEQFIDFTQVTSGAGVSAHYVSTAAHSGLLEVTSGATLLAEVTLVGAYTSATIFNVGSGIDGGIAITDPPSGIVGGGIVTLASLTNNGAAHGTDSNAGASNVALLGNYMASLFAAPEGEVGSATAQEAPAQAALAHPHA